MDTDSEDETGGPLLVTDDEDESPENFPNWKSDEPRKRRRVYDDGSDIEILAGKKPCCSPEPEDAHEIEPDSDGPPDAGDVCENNADEDCDEMTIGDLIEDWTSQPQNGQPTQKKKQFWKKKPWEQSLSEFVVSNMTHNPCGRHAPGGRYAPCQKGGKCGAKMPRDIAEETDGGVNGYAAYRRREYLMEENNKMPTKKKFISRWVKGDKRGKKGLQYEFDARWLPGYNPALLMKYRCHINVEYCGSIKAINYLYKYIYKGTDQAYMSCKQYKDEKDEIKLHKYGRILTANECHYRISEYHY